MRKNEFTSVEQFKAQYIGIWGPSDNHWLGLDFIYHGIEYRFNTGSMYSSRNTILPEAAVLKRHHPEKSLLQRKQN